MKNAWLIKVLISSMDNPVITSCNFMAQWCMKKDTYLLLILFINIIILFILGPIKSSTQVTKKFTTSSWKKCPDLYYVKYSWTWSHIYLIWLIGFLQNVGLLLMYQKVQIYQVLSWNQIIIYLLVFTILNVQLILTLILKIQNLPVKRNAADSG